MGPYELVKGLPMQVVAEGEGLPVVFVNSSGEVTGNSADVYLQDQTTRIIDFYFKRQLGTATLAANTVVGSYTLTLANGHGAVVGNYLSILEGNIATQLAILNVNTNIITVDSPIDVVYTPAAEVRVTTTDLNVDGSSTPVVFNIVPAFTNKWHINVIAITIEDNAEMDTAKFGGITALTRGILIRRVDGETHNITNIKTNGEFRTRHFDVEYDTKAPSGTYGLLACKHFNGQEGNGCAILLNGATRDELQIVIQDNLTTLSKMRATVQGHYVLD